MWWIVYKYTIHQQCEVLDLVNHPQVEYEYLIDFFTYVRTVDVKMSNIFRRLVSYLRGFYSSVFLDHFF